MANMVKVVVVKPHENPVVTEIEDSLEGLMAVVEGHIEFHPYKGLELIINEEGKLQGLPRNRALLKEDGTAYDIVVGTFLVTNTGKEGETVSVTDEQIKLAMELFDLENGEKERIIFMGVLI